MKEVLGFIIAFGVGILMGFLPRRVSAILWTCFTALWVAVVVNLSIIWAQTGSIPEGWPKLVLSLVLSLVLVFASASVVHTDTREVA